MAGEVLVTGASHGLGYLLAQEFARKDCRIANITSIGSCSPAAVQQRQVRCRWPVELKLKETGRSHWQVKASAGVSLAWDAQPGMPKLWPTSPTA